MITVTHPSTGASDALDLFGASPSGARILRYFLLRPQAAPHARELQRILDLGGRSLQRELERLVELGALERYEDGRLVRHRIVEDSGVWRAVRLLAAESEDPTALLESALADVAGIGAAFVFGSTAEGTQREDSDIDIFVLEEPDVERKKLLRQVAEVGLVLERDVNSVRYTAQSLAERLGDREDPAYSFLRNCLTGPKRWLAGTPEALSPLVTAAGLGAVELIEAAR